MTFVAPALLAALALLLPVIAAFLVRRRHTMVRVPSTMLFRFAAASTSRSRRMKNLKRLVALLACALGVAALILAAARPTGASRGETVVFVVDVSASMEAGSGTRPLGQARRHITTTLAAAGTGDRYAIIAAGASPVALAGPVPSGPELTSALDKLKAERGGADLGAAIELAAGIVEGIAGARIVVLSDGGESLGDALSTLREPRGLPLTARTFTPKLTDNLGIQGFATRPPADASGDDEREALVSIATSSDKARVARVIVTAEGHEIARRRLDVPAQGAAELRVRVRASASNLTARVEPEDGLGDALAGDDEAALAEVARLPPRVLLVSGASRGAADAVSGDKEGDGKEGDGEATAFFAEKALLAAGAKEIVHVPPSLDGVEIKSGDVLVAATTGPSHRVDLPALYLGTRTGSLPYQGFREISAGATKLRSVEGRDALLRGVVLDGVTVERATAIDVPQMARALVELDGGTVVVAGGAGQRAWVYLGIDPARSDLVLRVAFPVLVANALSTIGGASNVISAETYARGEIAMRRASLMMQPLEEEPAPVWHLPASPAALLSALAALLLAFEAWTFRKGWAE